MGLKQRFQTADDFIFRVQNAQPRVHSLDNVHWRPQRDHEVTIHNSSPRWMAKSKVASRQNLHHTPGGGDVQIFDEKIFRLPKLPLTWWPDPGASQETDKGQCGGRDGNQAPPLHSHPHNINNSNIQRNSWPRTHHLPPLYHPGYKHVTAKVGSLRNIHHVPGGGNVRIHNKYQRMEAEARIGSLDNMTYAPGGGFVKVLDVSPSLRYIRYPGKWMPLGRSQKR